MGHKKGYNWKAREQPGGSLDMAEVKQLNRNVDLKGIKESDSFTGSNSLVLPAKKLKFTKEKKVEPVGRILSKKQRKRLEKIVDVKKKKAERGELLSALEKVQVDASVLSSLESLSSVQTKGVKRQIEEEQTIKVMQTKGKPIHEAQEELRKNRKRMKLANQQTSTSAKARPSDPNVLGFEESSEDDESDDESSEGAESVSDSEEAEGSSENHQSKVEGSIGDNINSKDKSKDLEQNEPEDPDDKKGTPCDQETMSSNKKKVTSDEASVVKNASSFKPETSVVFVPVNRPPDIIASRNKLPIIGEEQHIMECINSSQVVILSGETGSGKTTQVPQFLYEAGYASNGRMIGITEPRRVAATAMSARVAKELGLSESEVSYQIRFQGNVTKDTKIKFMTDGVLLREIEKDFLLLKYSVLILDEAHERSVFTDILIGLLSRIVPLRHKRGDPLKLVIMSATLRVEDFTANAKLFGSVPPPVISVDSRQFPVTVHFNKVTVEDYLGEAYKKVCKIHRQLPEGGILVFVTGQAEVNQLAKRLRQTFPGSSGEANEPDQQEAADDKLAKPRKKVKGAKEKKIEELPEINLDNYAVQPPEDLECEGELSDDDEEDDKHVLVSGDGARPLHVLPLYSLLSQEKQNRVFSPPPAGSRLCVISTNVAETSLTIPGVKYVVDTGKVKTKFYDKVTGVTTFVVTWISQAAGNQRAGRAGRQGPGHCYRLFSSAVFNNDLKDFSEPEIRQKPADGLLLQMKAMNIDKVVNFPFPSPPDLLQLRTAEQRLQTLGLLSAPDPGLPLREADKIRFTSSVTPLGKAVANFPVAPRFGKMLALADQHGLLPHAVALVSCLSIQEVLVERGVGSEEEQKAPKQIMEIRRAWVGTGSTLSLGDPMVLLSALCIAEKSTDTDQFCREYGLRPKALLEIRRLRRQLCSEIEVVLPGAGPILQPGLNTPSPEVARLLQQLLLAGCGEQVGRRMNEGEEGYVRGGYRIGAMSQPAFLHSSSVLKKRGPAWVVYQEVFETDKVYLRCVTEIQPDWLARFLPGLCNLGKALDVPPPRYCTQTGRVRATFKGTFGPGSFPLPELELDYPQGLDLYKQFGRFLLEGLVAPELAKFTSSLLSNPVVMTKSWSNLQPRTEILYKSLAAAKVGSAGALKRRWETEPEFLLSAYQAWLPEVLKDDVKKLWPPDISV